MTQETTPPHPSDVLVVVNKNRQKLGGIRKRFPLNKRLLKWGHVLHIFLWALPLTGQEVSEAFPLVAENLLNDLDRADKAWVAVGERGHVLRSEDAGRNWRQILVPTRELLTAVAFAPNEKQGTAVGHKNTILTTYDGGLTWTLNKVKGEFPVIFLDTLWLDSTRVYAVGAYGEFWESKDAGKSWSKRWISEEELHFNTMEKASDGTLFLAGENGTLLRSSDQGENWDLVDTPYYGSYHGLLVVSSQRLWLLGMRGHIFQSKDSGENWDDWSRDSKVFLSGATEIDPGRFVIVGQGGLIYTLEGDPPNFQRHLFPVFDKMSAVAYTEDGALILTGNRGVHRLEPAAVTQLFQPTE